MKKTILLAATFLSISSAQAVISHGKGDYKNEKISSLTQNGSCHLESVVVGDLSVSGSAHIVKSTVGLAGFNGSTIVKETIFTRDVKANGSFKAKASLFKGNVIVRGKTDLEDCVLEKSAEFYGKVEGDKIQFKGDVKAYSSRVDLEECDLKNLTVVVTKNSDRTPEVKLEDSVVSGDIVFADKAGVVLMSGTSKVIGDVKNGKIVKEKKSKEKLEDRLEKLADKFEDKAEGIAEKILKKVEELVEEIAG